MKLPVDRSAIADQLRADSRLRDPEHVERMAQLAKHWETDDTPPWAVGVVCGACRVAALISTGALGEIRDVDAHSECDGPGKCDCGCAPSRYNPCSVCGRPESDQVDGRCVDTAACARALAKVLKEPAPRPVKASKAASKPAPGLQCGCGCGAAVKRRFLPGHDAKLAAQLVREARGGDRSALERMRRLGWESKIPAELR